ncbi:MAG: LCP family protein [Clostridium sp.]|nr:LCP family protein [Clostridium sp.]
MSNENKIHNTNKKHRKKKKKSVGFKILMVVLALLIFGVAVAVSYGFSVVNKMESVDLKKDDLGITSKEDLKKYEKADDIKNIALFGIDSEDGTGRSDAIMIATIDSSHNKLKITSVMRDSFVNIPEHGMDKINHAYAYGGPTLAIKTLNENFGLNIDEFASVNFDSLPTLVEAFGGVEVTLNDDEAVYVSGIGSGGTYTLNGQQALDYSRIRKVGNDYERTERQRTVLTALFKKGISMPKTSYPSMVNTIAPVLTTSLNTSDILALATKVVTMGNGNLLQDRFPRDEDIIPNDSTDGIYYMKFDIPSVKQKMQDYIFDDKTN